MGSKITKLPILDDRQQEAHDVLSYFGDRLIAEKKKFSFFMTSKMGEGVYLHGDVGRGKTMLMDDFFATLQDDEISKRRVHFYDFMKDVHEYLHEYRQSKNSGDAMDMGVSKFAESIAKEYDLLCFDEFHVTDVADAMILSKLFTKLFEENVWIVMTSNWMPDNLYKGGIHRDRIIPFIDLIKEQMKIVELDGAVDYRKLILKGHDVYFSPLDKDSEANLNEMVDELTSGKEARAVTLEIKGRELVVEHSYGDVATFSFAELCDQALGAEDYLAIASEFKIVVIKNIPEIDPEKRNVAKRFMTLIDVLYDKGILLIASAEVEPDKIYSGYDHSFEFERTVSRLIEMQGKEYIESVAP